MEKQQYATLGTLSLDFWTLEKHMAAGYYSLGIQVKNQQFSLWNFVKRGRLETRFIFNRLSSQIFIWNVVKTLF
jgi:hypothetical protein